MAIAEKYLRKGSKIYVEGSLQTRKWTDTNNIERYTTEVLISRFRGELTMLDSRSSGSENTGDSDLSSAPLPSNFDELNDEVPF
jgi:single-strand DNA-binding protein